MSVGNKLIQKVRRKAKEVHKDIDGDFKRYDKVNEQPKVLAKSVRAYKLAKSVQRRFDRNFGIEEIAAKPLLAVNFTASTVERYAITPGVYGIRLTIDPAVLAFAGFLPGDIVEFLSGSPILLGQYLEVILVQDTVHVILEDVPTFVTSVGVPEITHVTTVGDNEGAAEVTSITTVADTGALEQSSVTAVADVGALEATTIVAVADISGSLNSTFFTFSDALDAHKYYVWFDDGGGVDPTPAGFPNGIHVVYTDGASAATLGGLVRTAIGLSTAATYITVGGSGSTVTLTNKKMGNSTDAADGAAQTHFSITVNVQGHASTLNNSYFTFSSALDAHKYFAWYNINSEGSPPVVAGRTGIEVDAAAGASASTLGGNTRAAIVASAANTYITTSGSGANITLTNDTMGNSTDTADGTSPTGFTISVVTQGHASNLNSSYFTFNSALDAHKYFVWYNINGEGVLPVVPGYTAISVTEAAGVSANTVGGDTRSAITSAAGTYVTVSGSTSNVTITNKAVGHATDAADGSTPTGFTILVTMQGVDIATLNDTYFTLNSAYNITPYAVWFNVAGTGIAPTLPGVTLLEADIADNASANTVAAAVVTAFTGVTDFVVGRVNNLVTITNTSKGIATDAADGTPPTNFMIVVFQQGTNDVNLSESGDVLRLEASSTKKSLIQ